MAMRGLLLINLGTPDEPQTGPVRRYLREFLSDPFVIDLNPAARWLLLNAIILPFRPARSAEAYRKIWTEQGSPLLLHSFDLVSEVARALEGKFMVQLGMRYGNPSLESAIRSLLSKGVDDLTVLPLYPQYATSSTQSTVERVKTLLAEIAPKLPTTYVGPFHDRPEFLDAFAAVAKPVLADARPDHVLFSFHGLPERHITQLDRTGAHCLKSATCCDVILPANSRCYRAQSFQTARALAQRLGLSADQFTVSFQSRLTRRWIRPFTDEVLPELAARGVEHVAVICPAFVADCLETVEEIGIRGKETFLAAGGKALTLVPSLNANPVWVKGVSELVQTPPAPAEYP